jgi:hypothetical protein
LKLLKKNIKKILKDIGISKIFLNRTPIAQEKKERTDKWDWIKFSKKFCTAQRKNQQSESIA